MGKMRRSHRRRRGRFAFLLKVFAFIVAAAAMLWAVALFFRMDHIAVSGNERYSEAEVLAASGLQTGGNLYFLNKFDVKEAIFEQLPYVETIRINRKLPDTLLIEVSECKAAAGVQSETGLWLISDRGKLLETVETTPLGCPTIVGAEPVEPRVTETVDLGEEAAYRLSVVLTLLQESEKRGMREKIGQIDLADDAGALAAFAASLRIEREFLRTRCIEAYSALRADQLPFRRHVQRGFEVVPVGAAMRGEA